MLTLTPFFKKVFIEFVTTLLLFYVLFFFGHKACEILAPQPGIELSPPALEGEVPIDQLPWTTRKVPWFQILASRT